jgi:transposase
MEKHTIITLMNQGKSLRETSKITGICRKTVTRYWKEYLALTEQINTGGDIKDIQEQITRCPKYDTSSRKPLKYNSAIDEAIDKLLDGEQLKLKLLGATHKQHLTCRQIHESLVKQGFDIGLSTVTANVSRKRQRNKEAFIRQEYELGQRLEYDFGEVRLVIGGVSNVYYIAALASPASNFRWGYLYANQKKESFMDSHVRFFEHIGGVWSEIVYDNMKNVVSRFIGKNEKVLNDDLVKMSIYYGFAINVTNCFSGNEKGYVESSVKWLRNKLFAYRYAFDTLEDAKQYMNERLCELNKASRIEEEKIHLIPARPPLELANISEHVVDKYSFIRIDNGLYSVPDYLVGHSLCVKCYPDEIIVYSGFSEVCRHKRLTAKEVFSVDIFHYLDTLARKPGAVKNSVALRSKARLKEIFDKHYTNCPKDFIVRLERLRGYPIDEVADIMALPDISASYEAMDIPQSWQNGFVKVSNIQNVTRAQLSALTTAFLGGDKHVACL